jgi:hypothetical protein
MQVIENRSDVVGRITEVAPHPSLPDHSLLTIQVDDVSPVEGYSNLFEDARGSTLEVSVSRDTAVDMGLRSGDNVVARIRRAGPSAVFADPDTLTRRC